MVQSVYNYLPTKCDCHLYRRRGYVTRFGRSTWLARSASLRSRLLTLTGHSSTPPMTAASRPRLVPPHVTSTAPCPSLLLTYLVPTHRTTTAHCLCLVPSRPSTCDGDGASPSSPHPPPSPSLHMRRWRRLALASSSPASSLHTGRRHKHDKDGMTTQPLRRQRRTQRDRRRTLQT